MCSASEPAGSEPSPPSPVVRRSTVQPCLLLLVLLVLLLLLLCASSAGAEWVEIPQLRPASVGSTASSEPVPVAGTAGGGRGGSFRTHSHPLLSHLSSHEPGTSSAWPPTVQRWAQRPVSSLVEYASSPPPPDGAGYRYRGSPWVTVTQERGSPSGVGHEPADGYHRRVAMVNVSSKVEPWTDGDDDDREVDGEEDRDDPYPPVQTQLLPFGNRYEEESIEASSPSSSGAEAPHHLMPAMMHPPHQQASQQFDDFDDYDERIPLRQQHQHQQHHAANYELAAGDEAGEQGQEEYEPVGDAVEPPAPAGANTFGVHRPVAMAGFGGFLGFLRRMQQTFVLRTAHTIGDKIRTLAGLRDQLLGSIERRIASLWMARGPEQRGRRRVKRGWMDPHADAMDFPSAEGALLTISFLTFAVFLIKLVLQVINTIKAKHYTYSTFAAGTPVTGGLLVKRTRRYAGPPPLEPRALERHTATILSAINSYKFT